MHVNLRLICIVVACSIVGNREDPGVLQRFCEDFFDAVAEVKLEERSLTAAFYEIYQEKVHVVFSSKVCER